MTTCDPVGNRTAAHHRDIYSTATGQPVIQVRYLTVRFDNQRKDVDVIRSVHEVRVTMRGVRLTEDGSPVQVSTRSDFIAPDLAPVATTEIEQSKGLKGWTRDDVKVTEPVNGGVIVGQADRILTGFTVGAYVPRKAPATTKVARRWR